MRHCTTDDWGKSAREQLITELGENDGDLIHATAVICTRPTGDFDTRIANLMSLGRLDMTVKAVQMLRLYNEYRSTKRLLVHLEKIHHH